MHRGVGGRVRRAAEPSEMHLPRTGPRRSSGHSRRCHEASAVSSDVILGSRRSSIRSTEAPMTVTAAAAYAHPERADVAPVAES